MSDVSNFNNTGNFNNNNTVRRTAAEDGGVVYTVAVNEETESMITSAANFHSCKREAILAVALSIYVSAFEESVLLAMTARDDGPRN